MNKYINKKSVTISKLRLSPLRTKYNHLYWLISCYINEINGRHSP